MYYYLIPDFSSLQRGLSISTLWGSEWKTLTLFWKFLQSALQNMYSWFFSSSFSHFSTPLNKMTAIQGSNSHTFPAAYPSPKYSKLSQLAFFHITSAAGLLLHMPRKYRTERNANQFLQNFLAIQIKQSKLPGSKEASQFRERRRRKQHLWICRLFWKFYKWDLNYFIFVLIA